MAQMRHRGCGGGAIPLHRALSTLRVSPRDVATALALALVVTLGWLILLPYVCLLWGQIFELGRRALLLDGQVVAARCALGPYARMEIPVLMLPARAPDAHAWTVAVLVTLLLLSVSLALPKRRLPFVYALRALAAVQISALLFFRFWPGGIPYSLAEYLADSLTAAVALLASIPLLLGFTCYLFDLPWWKKLGLTALALLHLSLFIPLRYLLQAYLLHHGSLLFMPLFALLFGLPLDALVVLAFYAWGMSWKERAPRGGKSRAPDGGGVGAVREPPSSVHPNC